VPPGQAPLAPRYVVTVEEEPQELPSIFAMTKEPAPPITKPKSKKSPIKTAKRAKKK
jgi:hypothetical protein